MPIKTEKIEDAMNSLIENQKILNGLKQSALGGYEQELLKRTQQSLLACLKHLKKEQSPKPLSKRLVRKWERFEKLCEPPKIKKRRASKVPV